MKLLKFKNTNQRGITLIEVSIGLIIAAIVAAAAYIAFSQNARRQQAQENATVVTNMMAELKAKFGSSGGYADFTTTPATGTTLAINSLVIPKELVTSVAGVTTAKNSYGGVITVAADATAGDNAVITYPAVPKEQCVDLVIAAGKGARDISVNTIAVMTGGVLTVGTASTECAKVTTSSLVFTVPKS